MTTSDRVECRRCTHFRSAPYEAKIEGCYLAANMVSKQSASYLDEQQLPGRHDKINLNHDCKDYEAPAQRPSLWHRILAS